MNNKIRTRLAPSPTGMVHVGTLRTALFGYLFAKKNNGVSILRIEDTDQTRKVEGALENLLNSMSKMGIEFDEGLYIENGQINSRGGFGPYVQSERLDLYHKYVKELLDNKKAYYCFCSSERLDELRKEQIALKKPPMYDKHCRNLSEQDVNAKLDEFKNLNQNPVVRQAIPESGETVVSDLVYGEIKYDNATLDDQVLLKSDMFPTYHLAVVVDDHLMGISHVFRGEEWLPSTPKHILLYQAFGWQSPEFAHLPLILNADKTKLSKRQGDVSVEDFLQKGYLPEALINFVALLGWNPKTEQEIFSMQELIAQFDLAKVHNSGAVFDYNKLDWINGFYIRQLSPNHLFELTKPYIASFISNISNFSDEYLLEVVKLEQERLKTLSQITEQINFYFEEPVYESDKLVWRKSDSQTTKDNLQKLVDCLSNLEDSDFMSLSVLEEKVKKWISQSGLDNGSVLWPMRVALTGLDKSPSPFEVGTVLFKHFGKEGIVERLNTAIRKL